MTEWESAAEVVKAQASLEQRTGWFPTIQPVLDAPDLTDAMPNATGGENHGDI